MILPKSIINYCRNNNIRYEQESETDFEFIAPAFKVFSTESKYRVIEIYEQVGLKYCRKPVVEIKRLLTLFNQ